MAKLVLTDDEKTALKRLVDDFEDEDRDIRDRQVRTWRKLKLLFDGFSRVWYDEVAHDWRIYDEQQDNDAFSQDYYDKPINVFRAYLESIIAALSTNIPPIKCYPDDADNNLDIATAKAGDKISELIDRHNNVSLLWLHALFTYCTEGMTAAYNYTEEDEKYGTYESPKYGPVEEEVETSTCPNCGNLMQEEEDKFDPGDEDVIMQDLINMGKQICQNCLSLVDPMLGKETIIVERMVGTINKPKARQCIEVYGGLYVKIPLYAKKQKDCLYLLYSYETNYAFARERYQDIRDQIAPEQGEEAYIRWGRNNPQYRGEMPRETVTMRNCWIRPASFEMIEDEKVRKGLKNKFPNGAKVVFVDQIYAEACNEDLDDHWTLTYNPLANYLTFDPIGLLLTSIQEITNDLISLTLQTIEHGIPQTFADTSVLDFKKYKQMESAPGAIYPATPKSGKEVKSGFYEVKTATLSAEVMPFGQNIQELGQLVSGALPSLFGGQIGGSGTASEYSMSRAQALQRLQSTWKMFTVWWKEIHGKVIPAYIKDVKEDERYVEKTSDGSFINILIRKADLEGKIGSFEIESNENLPMTWNQRKDFIMQLLQANNPQILQMIANPENLPLIYDAIGIPDFYVPGEDSRNKQYDEIKQLLASEPIVQPPDEMQILEAVSQGIPPEEVQPIELPSIEPDELDDNAIEFETCKKWASSLAGQLAKIENPAGYKNVLLHAIAHKNAMQMEMIQQAQQQMISSGEGAAPLANPKKNTKAPINEETDVPTT